jgi:hypothetical protein
MPVPSAPISFASRDGNPANPNPPLVDLEAELAAVRAGLKHLVKQRAGLEHMLERPMEKDLNQRQSLAAKPRIT